MTISHVEGDNSMMKSTAAKQWGQGEAIFVWFQQLIEPAGTDSVPCPLTVSQSTLAKSGKVQANKQTKKVISFLLKNN